MTYKVVLEIHNIDNKYLAEEMKEFLEEIVNENGLNESRWWVDVLVRKESFKERR